MPEPLLHAELTYYLRGVAYQLHRALGGGHAEQAYENAFCIALDRDGTPYRRQPQIHVSYKGWQVGEYYPDVMLAEGRVLLDFKAAPTIEALHKAQVLSYLAVTNAELGLLLNFGASSMGFERLPNFLGNHKPFAWTSIPHPGFTCAEITDQVLSALHEVHYELGPGFLHQVYRRAVRRELSLHALNFDYLKELPVRFEMHVVGMSPTRLFLIERCVLLGVIAAQVVTPQQIERLRWAMRETDARLGLIANFYPSKLQVQFLSATR